VEGHLAGYVAHGIRVEVHPLGQPDGFDLGDVARIRLEAVEAGGRGTPRQQHVRVVPVAHPQLNDYGMFGRSDVIADAGIGKFQSVR